MDEIFPIGAGFMLGVLFAVGGSALRRNWIRAALVIAAGLSATLLSGEYQDSWGFAVVDIGEVALTAWIGFVIIAWARTYWYRRQHAAH